MISFRSIVLALGAGLMVACVQTPPTSLTVGIHDVQLQLPEGWECYGSDRELTLRQKLNRIVVEDRGPATPDAFRREILEARASYLRGGQIEARERVASLGLRDAVPTQARWEAIAGSWDTVRLAGLRQRSFDDAAVGRAFDHVLAEVATLPPRDLEALADAALLELEPHGMRVVAEQEPMAVGGHAALRVDTWDRLSHDHRKRHVFVVIEGDLLVVRMVMGRFSELEPAFDAVIASFEVPSSP